jgi:hypothetical protein
LIDWRTAFLHIDGLMVEGEKEKYRKKRGSLSFLAIHANKT